MRTLQADAATGFAWLRSQETSRRRTGSNWQTRVLFQSESAHRMRPYHAAVFRVDRTLFALCGRLRGRICAVADGGHDHPVRLPPRHRHCLAAPCLPLVESVMPTDKRLPQFVASRAVTGCHRNYYDKPPCAFAVFDINMQSAIAALWATVLCGVSVAMATIISVMRASQLSGVSPTPIVSIDPKLLIPFTLTAQQVSSLDECERRR